ncbi:MAG: hypothetical protein LBP54_07555 [Campylobacteraceae bacterium]|nr:hypothetical protein [Campylobacteraceae bacterium]
MGTDNSSQTKQLQKEIKYLLKKIGVSQAEFVKRYSDSSEEEVKSEIEKFKKHLQRETTKPAILQQYLNIIYESHEYEKLNTVKLRPKLKNDKFSENFKKEMKKISEYIDEIIENKDDLSE